MLHDVSAIEIDVFNERSALLTVKNYVLMFSRRTAFLDHNADRFRWTDRRVRNIRRNEERFAFAHEMIDDAVAFADAYFDVAFELIKIFFGIDEMKIVPGIGAFDHHHKKVAPVVEITIADRRLEFFTVLFDPIFEINRRLNGGPGAFFLRKRRILCKSGHETSVFPLMHTVNKRDA